MLTRAQVLAYRVAVHRLERPAGDPMRDGVLPAGVQDVPPGRTAAVALRVRGAQVDPARLVLVHSVRAVPHLHRGGDVACFAAALRPLQTADLAQEHLGTFGQQLADHDIGFAWAVGHAADAMRLVCADGRPRTKGELSTALMELVDARLRPWCPGCAAHHVQDTLFRYATLRAGLSIAVRPAGFQYLPSSGNGPEPDPADSQTTLVRRFLRLCGPCRPENLGRWLALRPAAARRLWHRLDDQLVPVTVDGRDAWMHRADLDDLRTAPAATDVALLPPYDPYTELADRDLLLPDRSQRAAVWRAVGNPGTLLVRGEIAGTWRQRTTARRLTVTIQPFTTLGAADRTAASRHADLLTDPSGPPVETRFAR